jgi:hypothetical protein
MAILPVIVIVLHYLRIWRSGDPKVPRGHPEMELNTTITSQDEFGISVADAY